MYFTVTSFALVQTSLFKCNVVLKCVKKHSHENLLVKKVLY